MADHGQGIEAAAERDTAGKDVWWGEFEVAADAGIAWEVGPLRVRIDRRAREWQIRHRHEGGPLDDRLQIAAPVGPLDEATEWEGTVRIAGDAHDAPFRLVALTADRPVVSQPSEPFFILPSESVRLFVSTPMWVGVDCGSTRLCDLPTTRPSDTWFGPTVGPGEAAYANRMHCRQELSELPFRPHRAVSPITVRNRSARLLSLERVVINVPYLSLFSGPDGRVWTEEIDLSLLDDDEIESSISSGPPSEVASGRPISVRRRTRGNGVFSGALASIF